MNTYINGEVMLKFTDLNIQPEIQKALDELGFEHPTEIQAQAIPALKDKKVDFHGQAQTGTGKTLAFGIPLLEHITFSVPFPQALIIAPTRELAVQIVDSLKAIAKYKSVSIEAIYGGMSLVQQEKALKNGVDIVVGTPGRLLDHVRRGTLKLHRINTLVLDEADVMLDMGFKPDIDALLNYMPAQRAIWLFSATIKDGIQEIKTAHMRNPIECRITPQEVATKRTKQYYSIVHQKDRFKALLQCIRQAPRFYGIVFTPTKALAGDIARDLAKRGYNAEALHGDMNQVIRNKVIQKFKDKERNILIATDVAARGIDVTGLTHVINYALPHEQENYVHRIGRTGRAGNEGTAITFVSQNELRYLKKMAKTFNAEIVPLESVAADEPLELRVDQAIERFKQVTKAAPLSASMITQKMIPFLDTYSKDELMMGIVQLLIPSQNSLSVREEQPRSELRKHSDHGVRELMLAIGTQDGISQADIVTFIGTQAIEKQHIKKIRVMRKRTFLKVTADQAEHIALALDNKKLGERMVKVRFIAS